MPIRANQNGRTTEYRLDYTGGTAFCTGSAGYTPSDFSWAGWIYVDTIGGVSEFDVFWAESNSAAGTDCALVYHYRNAVGLQIFGTTGTKDLRLSSVYPYRGWMHLAFTVTASGGAWNTTTGMKVYVNGVDATASASLSSSGSGNTRAKDKWHLLNGKSGTLANQRVSGCIHRIHTYSRVLSAAEALSCFQGSEPSDYSWRVLGDSTLNGTLSGGATDTAVPLASTPTLYTAAFGQTGWAAYRKNTGITGTTQMSGWTESQGHVTNLNSALTTFPWRDSTFANHVSYPKTFIGLGFGATTGAGNGASAIANSCTLAAVIANPAGRPSSGQSTYNVMCVNASATAGPTIQIVDGKLAVSDGTRVVGSGLFVPATPTFVACSIDPLGVDFYVEDKTERVTFADAGVTWGTGTVAYGSSCEYIYANSAGTTRFEGDIFAVGIRNSQSTSSEVATFRAQMASDHGLTIGGYSALIVFSGDSQSARHYQNPNEGLAKQMWTALYPRCRMFVAAVPGNTIADVDGGYAAREAAIRTQWTKPGKDILVGWYGHNENWFTGSGAGGAFEAADAATSFSNLTTLMGNLSGFTHRIVMTTIPRAEKATASENERFHRCRLLYNASVMASNTSAGQTRNIDIAALSAFLVTQGSGATSAQIQVITGGTQYIKSSDAVYSSQDGDSNIHINATGSATVAGTLQPQLSSITATKNGLVPVLAALGMV